ncbi:hypothetical protein CHLRE_03g143887v5 [Chlamydomonas reinhardtii]|uniref:arginine--tRNA ligase n=1 Tax=Chlamydomonas reinhardtii TaxID=3055 RepID=A0A2K3DV46_CHLRE|nr:uncharacterized protein CHLRE_03g143887v5 [Chlamydomonas reinhardtii]PNW84382.1 hypothetical protein CHLRE_03g143887v5 [Chlamydomonas reinhardtii]
MVHTKDHGSVRAEVADLFRSALNTAYPNAGIEPVVAACNNAKNGDYQCNNAMALFGKLKGTENAPKAPRDVANAILAALPANDLISETSLAGPGFINIRLNKDALARRVGSMLTDGLAKFAPEGHAGKKVVIDFSSPNVAKEMHVGHLRSTIIGDTLCRVFEYCGSDVLRLNHVGDWGTQFGMLIEHMADTRKARVAAGGEDADKDEDVADLQELYRAAKKRFDEEEEFKTRAREAVTRLQSGDATSLASWQRICAASRREFEALYTRLGVTLQERGESFYNPMLKGIVDGLKETGVATIDDGATCVFVEGQSVPLIVQKSDGGFGYASTDMAALHHRLNEEKADWIIYVTDVGQSQHFELVFGAAKKAGWLKEAAGPKVSHVGFGLVLGEDGKRFRTRSGDLVRLVELLDEAKSRCAATIRERRQEAGEEIVEAEVEEAACAMGYGAVKYADLKNHRTTNYKFSFDDMLNLKGNTAVYLLYAHARIAGIVRKGGKDVYALAASTPVTLEHPKELELALHLTKLPEALEDAIEELAPNRITDYLYDLSEKFNSFYVDCKVLGSEQEASRLLLVEATAVVMRKCFELLGIKPLYRI